MTPVAMRGRYGRYVSNLLTVSDFVVINLVYILAVHMNPYAWMHQAKLVGLLVNVAYLPAAYMLRHVRAARAIAMDRLMLNAVRAVGIHAIFFFSLLFFLDIEGGTWRAYRWLYGGIVIALPLWWIVSRLFLKWYRRLGRNYNRVLIVGTGPTARMLCRQMYADRGFGYRIVGFIDRTRPSDFPWPDLYAGALDNLDTVVRAKGVDEIYYTLSGDDDEAMHRSLTACDDNMLRFYLVPQTGKYITRAFQMTGIGSVPVMSVRDNPLQNILNRAAKRTFDLVVSGLFLIVSPLVFIPVAIAVKASSPGPVFFRQRRTGYRGEVFYCLKFRTMRVNNDADTVQATQADPRKTRVGDFLRRTSLDELPQFINVFLGQMSVVGPRPHMLAHTEQYSSLVAQYMMRHSVKPGITGWAQVNGYRGATDQLWKMEQRVRYDMWYIEHWSLMLDIKIFLRTIVNMLHGEENAV